MAPSGSTSPRTSGKRPTTRTPCRRRWIKTSAASQVGFVGAVTEDLPALVCPDGIADIEVTDIVDEVNAAADKLKADGADVVVLLVHEGAANTSYAAATDPNSDFGKIVNGVDEDVDAIVSGHTHLAYNHSVPVPAGWPRAARSPSVRSSRPASTAPSSTSSFTVDPDTGEMLAKSARRSCRWRAATPVWTPNFPADPAIKAIVDAAVAKADVLGAQSARPDRGPVQPGQAGQRHHREPRWRVHAGQPGRRGPALGDASHREAARRSRS